jgi:hypothetical protein
MWRCLDCTLSYSLCRQCMRHSHMPAPLHRIEYWNGSYFRPASLWEVGTYLLVQHHDKEGLCSSLEYQKSFLERQQLRIDEEEQNILRHKRNNTGTTAPGTALDQEPVSITGPAAGPEIDTTLYDDINMSWNSEANADSIFEAKLDNLLYHSTSDKTWDDNFESDDGATDIHNMVEYLGPYKNSVDPLSAPEVEPVPAFIPGPVTPGADPTTLTPGTVPDATDGTGSEPRDPRPTADGLNNAYVRVLHTNGIHHIGMVTCSCGGHDQIPLDLFASRLLPASFFKIRSIFTAQLMDYFRLCNLELKASAYQFYQLIRRLTLPMGNAEMVNLYHEFRRMSRLWRWMKKLKWAGYGHNQQDHLNPPAGSLSIFCPTCPQPKLNLPEDWKLDKNRYNIFLSIFLPNILIRKLDLYIGQFWLQMEISRQIM